MGAWVNCGMFLITQFLGHANLDYSSGIYVVCVGIGESGCSPILPRILQKNLVHRWHLIVLSNSNGSFKCIFLYFANEFVNNAVM